MSGESGRSSAESDKRSQINILSFHKLSLHLSFGSTNYSPARFGRLIERLESGGFTFLPLTEVVAKPDQESVAVCFDDGYAHLTHYLPPLMDKYGIEPTIFVPTGYLGKPNNWDYSHIFRTERHLSGEEIRQLADRGVSFGSHGHSHCDLTALSAERVRSELADSKRILEDILGREIATISYPFGRFNQRVMEAAESAGYRYGFTMSYPEDVDTALGLGRFPIYFYDSPRSVLRKLRRGRLYRFEKSRARFTNKLSGGTVLFNRLRRLRG